MEEVVEEDRLNCLTKPVDGKKMIVLSSMQLVRNLRGMQSHLNPSHERHLPDAPVAKDHRQLFG
jgi:hypothetical protein